MSHSYTSEMAVHVRLTLFVPNIQMLCNEERASVNRSALVLSADVCSVDN